MPVIGNHLCGGGHAGENGEREIPGRDDQAHAFRPPVEAVVLESLERDLAQLAAQRSRGILALQCGNFPLAIERKEKGFAKQTKTPFENKSGGKVHF